MCYSKQLPSADPWGALFVVGDDGGVVAGAFNSPRLSCSPFKYEEPHQLPSGRWDKMFNGELNDASFYFLTSGADEILKVDAAK